MKDFLISLSQSELFQLFFNGVIIETIFLATLISIFQSPPEIILDSGLREILMIFED